MINPDEQWTGCGNDGSVINGFFSSNTVATKFRFNKKHWKDFTKEDLEVIEKERKENLEKLKKLNFGKRCPACIKPNSVNVDFCTGCNFTLKDSDIIPLPKNIFLDIITGKEKGTKILFRNKELCLFDDKFGVNPFGLHIDVIPIEVIEDIKVLNKSHIPLLKNLYKEGLNEFKKRGAIAKGVEYIEKDEIEDNLVVGFNFPVSVKHLHVHMVLPPFKHRKVFQYPRWHSYKKVLGDLEKFGMVKTYDKNPNNEEGKNEYDRAIQLHEKYVKKLGIKEKEEKK